MPIQTIHRQHAIEHQIRQVERRIQQLEAKRNRFARCRPVVFLAGVVLSYWTGWISLIMTIIVMSVEAVYYNRIGRVIRRFQLWRDIKSTQIARMTLDWEHIPVPPFHAADEKHPFEVDLDITGERSLHHLIDTAISREGSQRLREWLLQPRPDLLQIERRRSIIRELVPLSRFRDKLLLNFRLVSQEHLDGDKLLRWLQTQRSSKTLQRVLYLSMALAGLNLILSACYVLGWLPALWLFSFPLYLIMYFANVPKTKRSFDAVMLLYDELEKFKTILQYLEAYPYNNTPHLKQLCAPFCQPQGLPSALLKKITWLTTAVGLRMNPALAIVLNIVVPWDIIFAFLIDRCHAQCARQFPQWVDTWSELEGLVSLANFAYLHPGYIFPNISSENTEHSPIFEAMAMGHPLIPDQQKVCNDYAIQTSGELTLLTGSNMAGKSTFLKTAGINLCLAYAGSVVNAAAFRTNLFRLYSCIQIHDSVTDGFSFFYAEVKRLRTILDALHSDDSLPVCFLIDEIFKGTNSRERLIGGRAYIYHLSKQSGVGLIATHDLELGQLAEQISGLRNMHFRDAVADGKMVFDFTLRPGVCPTTNALKIMQMEGLPVELHE